VPKKNYPYVLSGDTAGEGSDYFTGQVLNNVTGNQCAVLRKEFDADEYTRQMICLAKYYNNALEGIEANFDTYPIKESERLGYKNQYVRIKEDSYTGKTVKAFGFRTDRVTRPLILSELQAIVNDHIENINDKDTLEEMLVFVRNEKGRPEAQLGAHDDLVMALAIAHYIRPQQSMTVKVDIHELEYNIMKDFGFEEESQDEFGSKIEVF
jgi:phage terminase large subunit